MKTLFVFVPATLLVLFLVSYFVPKEKEADKENRNQSSIFKSADGGKTWQDISNELPEIEQPVRFFAGDSDLYMQAKNSMYHSKSNLKTLVWEKENIPGIQNTSQNSYNSIVFSHSGVIAFNYNGQMYQKTPASKNWLPMYTNFNKHATQIFEAANRSIFLGLDRSLHKSTDNGKNWKEVQKNGAYNLVESAGVMLAMSSKGLMRSTDNGEHWQWIKIGSEAVTAIEPIKGGFAVMTYNYAVRSRRLCISLDGGKTWKINDIPNRALYISSIKQMGKYLICSRPDGIFQSADMGKTWNKVHPGVDENEFKFPWWGGTSNQPEKVLKLYVSGKALYAMTQLPGC